LRLAPAEFATAARLRLGVPVLCADSWCCKCDKVLDAGGFHATACLGGGDAAFRHNALRDYVYLFARSAGVAVEREEGGLLPNAPRRRPGDLFCPAWPGGTPVALDFAVTCPMKLQGQREAAAAPLAAAKAYEAQKLADRETARLCAAEGIRLVPAVAETLGGWGPDAQAAFKVLARAWAARSGQSAAEATNALYEGLAVRLQRANARAILARVGSASPAMPLTTFSEAALVAAADGGRGGQGAAAPVDGAG